MAQIQHPYTNLVTNLPFNPPSPHIIKIHQFLVEISNIFSFNFLCTSTYFLSLLDGEYPT